MLRRVLFMVCVAFLLVCLWPAVPSATAQSSEPWGYSLGQTLDLYPSEDVALGDLDGDGDLDLYFAKGPDVPDEIWFNQGGSPGGVAGYFLEGPSLGVLDSRAVALGDLDGDSDQDAFVVTNYGGIEVWRNNGNRTFSLIAQDLGGADIAGSRDVALGDLDGDGDLDAFVANEGMEADKVWKNKGNGTFEDSGLVLGLSPSYGVALGYLNDDDYLDAFVATNGMGHEVWLNDRTGVLTLSGTYYRYPGFGYDVALEDLNGDGYDDAVVACDGAEEVWLNKGDGSGDFASSALTFGAEQSTGVALGDVDLDGNVDAVIANDAGQPNQIWLSDGIGGFTNSGRALGSSWSRAVALGDLNGDSGLDVVIANSYDQADEVYLMVNAPTSVGLRKMTVSAGPNWALPAIAFLGALTLLFGRRWWTHRR